MPLGRIEHPQTLWIPVQRLLAHNQFFKYKLAARKSMTVSVRPPIPIFVSHRWQSLRNPDPYGYQHHVVVRFLLDAICLIRRLCERYFVFGSYPVVNDRLKDALRPNQVSELDIEWQQACRMTEATQTTLLLKGWYTANFPNLLIDDAEIVELAGCLERIGIWYDYSCMPQQPFSSESERRDFVWHLNSLNDLISTSHVLIAWDMASLDRAWCLYEALVAHQTDNISVDIPPNHPSKLHIEFDDQGEAVCQGSSDLAEKLDDRLKLVSRLSGAEIESFFREKKILTSEDGDLSTVATLLSSYLSGNQLYFH